ncbi:MAG: hypothetical protein ACT4RN_17025 [Pseudonocardia sp.]
MNSDVAARLVAAFDLHDFGMRMQRHRFRREQPGASEAEIDNRMLAWLRARPDAPHGDAEGTQTRRFG